MRSVYSLYSFFMIENKHAKQIEPISQKLIHLKFCSIWGNASGRTIQSSIHHKGIVVITLIICAKQIFCWFLRKNNPFDHWTISIDFQKWSCFNVLINARWNHLHVRIATCCPVRWTIDCTETDPENWIETFPKFIPIGISYENISLIFARKIKYMFFSLSFNPQTTRSNQMSFVPKWL